LGTAAKGHLETRWRKCNELGGGESIRVCPDLRGEMALTVRDGGLQEAHRLRYYLAPQIKWFFTVRILRRAERGKNKCERFGQIHIRNALED